VPIRGATDGRRALEAPKQPGARDAGRGRGPERQPARPLQPAAKPAIALPPAAEGEAAPPERPLGRDLVDEVEDAESAEAVPSYGARKAPAKPVGRSQPARGKSEHAPKGGGRRSSQKSAEKPPAHKPAAQGRRRPEPKAPPAAAHAEDEEFGAGIGE
jgi:hypothetical protein